MINFWLCMHHSRTRIQRIQWYQFAINPVLEPLATAFYWQNWQAENICYDERIKSKFQLLYLIIIKIFYFTSQLCTLAYLYGHIVNIFWEKRHHSTWKQEKKNVMQFNEFIVSKRTKNLLIEIYVCYLLFKHCKK